MTSLRTVLLIAFHFPPVKGSSGVQRTLRFAHYLPKSGWRPIVLTVDPRAYAAVAHGIGNEIPVGLEVHRAFGLDAARSLSVLGRYPRALALPDRWATWRIWAVRKALRIHARTPLDAIWSTFPIATTQQIALEVAGRTGLPWIAEFRDPMWQGDYPPGEHMNRAWRELERRIFSRADSVIVVTQSAASLYAERFPQFPASQIAVIENGYDEETFARACAATAGAAPPPASRAGPVVLLHSGVVYPSERDPSQLFEAVASLKRAGRLSSDRLQIVLRACGYESTYAPRLAALGISDIVRLEPAIDYLPALREMLTVDGLLILQAANCNAQVPAKLYEYLRAGRPILALTDAAGDSAQTLAAAGTGVVAPLDSPTAIEAALLRFLEEIRHDSWRRPPVGVVARYSRAAQSARLAQLLDKIAARRARIRASETVPRADSDSCG
jgi:glycosyltransferase involved in cell wall biosynthesis